MLSVERNEVSNGTQSGGSMGGGVSSPMLVDGTVLRGFFHDTREWARARRGLDLFHRAAQSLQTWAQVNAGFFIYRKRAFSRGLTVSRPRIYVPWGAFANVVDQVQGLVDSVVPTMEVDVPWLEGWIPIAEVDAHLQSQWRPLGISTLGVWPLVSRERLNGAIVVAHTEDAPPTASFATRSAILDAAAAQVSVALEWILAHHLAEEASQQDLLTGLPNRRGLENRWLDMVRDAAHSQQFLVVGIADLDQLKLLNDTKGHPAGDAALREIGEILARSVRTDDVVARWGGDEFALVLRVDTADASEVMDRLQDAVRRQSPYTISVGGATWGVDGDNWDTCYRVADARLYENKRYRT